MNKNYYIRNVFLGLAGSFILVFDNHNNYGFLFLALVNALQIYIRLQRWQLKT